MIYIHGSVEPTAPGGPCHGCRPDEIASIETAFVFQPIVDLTLGNAYVRAARVFGPNFDIAAERDVLPTQGITLMQGYVFAKPGFKAMPSISNAS